MSVIEALRTGKPLRRPTAKHSGSTRSGFLGHEFVRSCLLDKKVYPCVDHVSLDLISWDDLLADDWEVMT